MFTKYLYIYTVHVFNFYALNFCSANCGPISFSPNSHVLPYTSTLEGAIATITCKNFEEEIIAVCNQTGNWEVLNATGDVCTKFNTSGKQIIY